MRTAARTDLVCVTCIVLAAMLMHGHGLLRGRVLLPADIVLLMRPYGEAARTRFPEFRFAQNQMLGPIFEYYSWRHQVRQRIRAGEVPLWNPLEMSGNVLLANSQSAVLYPPNVLLYIFPIWIGINLVTLFHTLATGLLMYGFLRRVGLLSLAALTGALAWMLCGPMLVWTEFQTPTAVLCWLPGCLWAVEAIQQGRNTARCLMAGVACLAMSLTAGHPQFAFYVMLATALYAVWRHGLRGIALAAALVVLGILLSGATLLPVAEASRINHRSRPAGYAESVRLRLPPAYLAMLAMPNVLGNPRDYVTIKNGAARPGHPYVGAYDYIEYCHYAGIATLVLAMLALARGFYQRNVRLMAILGTLGLALALGTPVSILFYYAVPGYAQFYAPARAVCLMVFAVCVLGAHGVQIAMEASRQPETARAVLRALVVAASLCGVVGVASWPLLARQYPIIASAEWIAYEASNVRHAVVACAALGLAGAGLLAPGLERWRRISLVLLPAICAADLLLWGAGFNPATDPAMLTPPSAIADRLAKTGPARVLSLENPSLGIKSLVVPNYNAVVGYREVQGADSVHSLRYHRLMAELARNISRDWRGFPDNNTIRLPGADHPLLDALNMAWVTTCPPATLSSGRFVRESDDALSIWRNPRACGPAWLVGQVTPVDGPEAAVRVLSAANADPRTMATVEGAVPEVDAAARGTGSLKRFSAHVVEYEVRSTGRALLVTSEPVYPGWRAVLDHDGSSREVPILAADGILRSVVVPTGTSRIRMQYRPASFLVGLYCTGVALALWMAVMAGALPRSVKRV